jgi:hypothetical protein
MSVSSSAVYPDGGTLGVVGVVGPSPPTGMTPVANRISTTATTTATASAPPMSHDLRLRGAGSWPDWECDGDHGGGAETGWGPLS